MYIFQHKDEAPRINILGFYERKLEPNHGCNQRVLFAASWACSQQGERTCAGVDSEDGGSGGVE